MKIIILALTPLLTLAAAPAFAGWAPTLKCDNSRLVVDENTSAPGNFQLVIRNSPDALQYFGDKADIQSALNEKNEFIVKVSPGGPAFPGAAPSQYVGSVNGGPLAVVVSQPKEETYRVALWQVGYRGTNSKELANWEFNGCSRQ